MKITLPPSRQPRPTRSSVSGIGPTARLITPPTVSRKIRTELVTVDFDVLKPNRSQTSRRNARVHPAARPGSSAPPGRAILSGIPGSPGPSPCRSAFPATRRNEAPAGCRHNASAPCSRSCESSSDSSRRLPPEASGDTAIIPQLERFRACNATPQRIVLDRLRIPVSPHFTSTS